MNSGGARRYEPRIEPTFGQTMSFEARYEVDPIPGGKRFQGAWLTLDDGTRYLVAYRPVPEHLPFVDKRVEVGGRPYKPGLDTQHVQATHFQIDSIELAPGETPYATPPTELPAPPVVRTGPRLVACAGNWVQVIGTLESVHDDPDGYLTDGRLRLADGSEVLVRNVRRADWSGLQGKQVTVISRAAQSEERGKVAAELIGWHAICEGEVGRCGMDP